MTSRTAPSSAQRTEPRQQRSRQTVERILAAAEREIGEHGLAATTTRGIAARAGVSIGALYRFFADKDAIADAVAESYLDDVIGQYVATLESVTTPADVIAALHTLVDQAAELRASHPGYYRVTEELDPARDDSPAHRVRSGLIELFVGALRRAGVAADLISDVELGRVVELCIETVRHHLALAPADARRRAALVAELQVMVSAYLTRRLAL